MLSPKNRKLMDYPYINVNYSKVHYSNLLYFKKKFNTKPINFILNLIK